MQSRKIVFGIVALILAALGIVMLVIPPIHGGDDGAALFDNDSENYFFDIVSCGF